jgi:cation:H+ antiporter
VLAVLLLLVGLGLVLVGGWLAVRAAANLGAGLGWSQAFVGATVVAFGTSAPEFVVSLIAALRGSEGVALGNVVGSNITNVALVLGMAAVISPVVVDRGIFRRDLPVLIGATIALAVVVANGGVGRIEGGVLFAALVGFVVIAHRAQQIPGEQVPAEAEAMERLEGRLPPDPAYSTPVEALLTVAGIAVLAVGAQLFVTGASDLARQGGFSEFAIGATLVATGTSLPELVTSAVAAYRGMSAIAVANVIGSNIFNALGVLGVAALAQPIAVDRDLFRFELPVLAISSALLIPLIARRFRIGRTEGALLVAGFVVFTVLTLQRGAA